ncbi:MAG: hypothetical protein KME47_09655 [Nodosilinea sp. WJT8-NPBG4]|jgi:hypothetical protein|nr:hypothetical protein [Nodosilinea sp. WJT8-NPBG4]
MVDVLADKTYLAGAAITAKLFTFTRAALDTSSDNPTDFVGAAIELVLYNNPSASEPTVILDTDNGLTKLLDTESVQTVLLTISESNLAVLLGEDETVTVGYAWSITPVGGVPIRVHKGGGFDGKFIVEKESKAGR